MSVSLSGSLGLGLTSSVQLLSIPSNAVTIDRPALVDGPYCSGPSGVNVKGKMCLVFHTLGSVE